MSIENMQGSEQHIVSNCELYNNNTLLYLNGAHRHTGYLSPKIPLMSKSDMQEKDFEVTKTSDYELTAEGSKSCLSVKMLKSSNNYDLFCNSLGGTNFHHNSTSLIDKNKIRDIIEIIGETVETEKEYSLNSPTEDKNPSERNFPLETYECLDKYVNVTNNSKNTYSNELKNDLEFHRPKRSNEVVDTLDIKLTNLQSEGTVIKECFEKNIELQCAEVTDPSQACSNELSIYDPNHKGFMDPSNSRERKLADDYDCSQSLFSSPQSQVILANRDTPGDLSSQHVSNRVENNGMEIDSDLTYINETELVSCHKSEERISSDDTLELNSEELKGDFVYMIPKENEVNGYGNINSLTFTFEVQKKDHIESNCTSLEVNSFKSNLQGPSLPYLVTNREIELITDEDMILDSADEKDNVPVETPEPANNSPSLLDQIEGVDGSKSDYNETENPRSENSLDKFEYVKNLQQDKTFRSVLSLNKNGDPTFNSCSAKRLDFDTLLESDMEVTENKKPNIIFKTKSTRCVNKFKTPWKPDDLSMDEMNVSKKKQEVVSTESFKQKTTTTDALCIDEKVEDTSKTPNEKSIDFNSEISKTGEVERNAVDSNNCFEERSDSNIVKCGLDHTRSDNCTLQSGSYSVADNGNGSDLNYKSKPSPAHDLPDKNSDIKAVSEDDEQFNFVATEKCNFTNKRKDVVTKDVFYETRGKSKRVRISRTTCDFGTCSEEYVMMCTQNTCSQMNFRTDGNSQHVKGKRGCPPKCTLVNRKVKQTSEKNDILEKGKYLLGKIESRLLKIKKIIEEKNLTAKNVGRAQLLLKNLSPVLRKTEECYNYVDVRSMCDDFDRKISPKIRYLKNLQEVLKETVKTLILRPEENDHESDREEFREETSCGEDNLNNEDRNEENNFNNSMNASKSVIEEASVLETLNPPTILVESLEKLSKLKQPLAIGYSGDLITDSPSLVMNKQLSDHEFSYIKDRGTMNASKSVTALETLNPPTIFVESLDKLSKTKQSLGIGYSGDFMTESPSLVTNKQLSDRDVSNIKEKGTTAETIDIEDSPSYTNICEINETIPDSPDATQTLKELDQDLQFIPGRFIDHEEQVQQISQTVRSNCRSNPHFKGSDSNNGPLNTSEVKECRIITLAKLYQDNLKYNKVPGINRIHLVEKPADCGPIKPVHVKGHEIANVTEAQFSQSGKSSSILTNTPNRNQTSAPNNNNILAVQTQFNKAIQKDSIISNPIRFGYYFSKQNASSDNRGSSEVLSNLMNSAALNLNENSIPPQPVSSHHSFSNIGAKSFPNNSCEFISQRDPPLSKSLIKTDPMTVKLVDNNTIKPSHSIISVPCVDNHPTISSKKWTGTIPQLMSKGFLKPGKNVFSVHTPQEITFASLDEHGRIIGKNGIVYPTLVRWCADIPNFGQKLTNKICYERIYYQGCSLSQIRSAYQGLSDQAASQETPVIAPTRSDPEVIQRSISPKRPLLSKRGPIALNLLKMKLLLIGDNEVGPDSYDVDNWDGIDRWE